MILATPTHARTLAVAAAIITFVFDAPDDARRAADGFVAKSRDPRFSAGLRDAFAEMKPIAKGNDVELDIMRLFERTELLPELQALVRARQ